MPDPQMSVDDFAAKIKAKYPDYANIPNDSLVSAVVAKHPEYRDQVNFAPNAGLASPGAPPKVQMQEQPNALSSLKNYASNAAQTLGYIPDATSPSDALTRAFHPYIHPLDAIHGNSDQVQSDLDSAYRLQHSDGLINKGVGVAQGVSAMIPLIGSNLVKASNQMLSGDVSGGLGTTTGVGAQVAAAKLTPEAQPVGKVVPSSEAAVRLTDAVNPPAKQMPGMQKALSEQLDNIAQHASDTGKVIDSRAKLVEVLNSGAEAAKNKYYSEYLKPNSQVIVEAPRGYQGAVAGQVESGSPFASRNLSGSSPTLGQLDARLAEINATLNPSYEKGGMAAQAAVSSEARSALKAEAAGIRNTLYQELGARAGVDPAEIANTKNQMGSMRSLAEKIQLALDKERQSANKSASAPVSITPFNTDKNFLGDKAVNYAINKVRGNPGDNAVNEVFNSHQPLRQPSALERLQQYMGQR